MQRLSPRFRSVQFFMCEILHGAFYGGAMHVGVKTNNYLSESWHRLQFVTEFFILTFTIQCNRFSVNFAMKLL